MPGNLILERTGKIEQLQAYLQTQRIIYLSAFFCCGKTTLLTQLAEHDPRPKLWFDAAKDAWKPCANAARNAGSCLLLIDNLERLTDEETGRELAAFLSDLPEDCSVVLAGRAQKPDCIHALIASGRVLALGQEFVSFDTDEITRFFEEQGLFLLPDDVDFMRTVALGWPLAVQLTAQKLKAAPARSVMSLRPEVGAELRQIFMSDVFPYFSERERIVLYNLAPFQRFSGDMARIVTGQANAPSILDEIVKRSYLLFFDAPDQYHFFPFVQTALLREMKNRYSQEYIASQYRRVALYYELNNETSLAAAYYAETGNTERIRELLIRDSHTRPANGDYTELQSAYALLSEEVILESPELMKGKCMIESLLGHARESDRWYQELVDFVQKTPRRDARRPVAEEILRYLDISLAQRGTKNILWTLLSTAKRSMLVRSESWRNGFNIAGNSVSLLNGGKDFCRWVPKGRRIYERFRLPVELAMGRSGQGLADLAIGECELESNLTGDYKEALEKVYAGLSQTSEDLELRCAGIGIQSRILAAQGNLAEARSVMEKLLASLPPAAPRRLRQNLTVHLLMLELYGGQTQNARSWMDSEAPDETGDFIILDRYRYMLKLRLYIMAGQWNRTMLLITKLKQYFEEYDRPYLRIQLHLLQAVIYRRSARGEWRTEVAAALALAKQYRLVRVIADEGIAVVEMCNEMELPEEPWEKGVMNLTKAQSARYPSYLRQFAERPMFTEREEQVYRLMVEGYKNAKIAAILDVKERTIKYYTAEIYKKLGVETRSEAISRAAELGDIR